MFRLFFAGFLLTGFSLFAELSPENEKDRIILEESYTLASELLSKNVRDKVGSDLIKFCAWLNPEHAGVKAIRGKLVFGDPVTAVGKGDATKLAKMLMFRQKDFDAQSKKILYTVIANKVDPSNVDASVQLKQFQDSSYDISFAKALKDSDKPKLVDLAEVARVKKETDMKIEKENAELSTSSASTMSMSASEIDKMLDLIKFQSFQYSEATMCDAINRLTHKMYWRGVQFTLSGKRISFTGINVAPNGARFYISPLYQPRAEQYNLKNKTIREILDHMAMNMDIAYNVLDGEVAISDGTLPEFSDVPEEGLAANDLQKVMKDYNVKDLQKYRGKVIKMNGIVTGLGRGMDSRTIYFALDGGLIQLYASKDDVEQDVYKRLDTELEKWKKSGGMKKYRDAVRDAQKTGAEIERKEIANPKLYITFQATCTGMDKGRLIFNKPEFIYLDGPEEFLIRKK